MFSTIVSNAKGIGHSAIYLAYSRFLPNRTFEVNRSRYPYFYHRYNNTCETERSVEIPLALAFLQSRATHAVLEIGNVLNHYAPFAHTVVDKYEIADGVVNIDVCDFMPSQKYGAIISISTLEHVGWDEQPFDPQKTIRSIERLRQLLSPGGVMMISFPIGHNETLDQAVRSGTLGCRELGGMKRVSGNTWHEVPIQQLAACRLNPPYRPNYSRYRRTNAVIFAYF